MRLLPYLILSAGTAALAEPAAEPLPHFPALSVAEAEKAFVLREGYRISIAAAEPEVVDPVAISFTGNGRMLVAEMRDYSERRAEKLSRVRCLQDRDGDGRFETSTVFMDGLAWVTGVIAWKEGAFIAATPDIWWARDADGDGVAEERRVVFTGFGTGVAKLNVQALVNSLTQHPKNGRIYGVTAGNGGGVLRVENGQPAGEVVNLSGADFSFDPEKLDLRAESGTAQYGLTFDEWGNRFVCSNSRHLVWVAYDRNLAIRGAYPLPPPLVDAAADGPAAEVFRLSPEEPWRVVRTRWRASGLVPGIVEGGGRASGYFTGATGIHISRGSVCRGDAFIADVGSNLIHRKCLTWSDTGPKGGRAADEMDREFLASRDTWFRPVSFASGPDGGLYIVDMYREYIEHPDSLPPQLKKQMDLNSGNDRGRIWRILPDKPDEAPAASAPPAGGTLPDEILRCGSLAQPERVGRLAAHWRSLADSPLHRSLILATLQAEDAPRFFESARPADDVSAMKLAAELKTKAPGELLEKAAALRSSGTTDQRLAALECLRAAGDVRWSQNFNDPVEVRAAILRHLPETAPALLNAEWARNPAALRVAALEILTSSRTGRPALLRAIREKTVPASELTAFQADALRRDPATKEEAAKLLPPPAADRAQVIAQRQSALSLKGDAASGRAHFLARCAACHRDGADGFAVGPDRASFANKGAPLLLAAIVDPGREVAGQFAMVVVKPAAAGPEVAGVLVREDDAAVTVRQPGGAETTMERRRIAAIERPAQSLMPVGIENGLTDQELADLLAFLMRK